MLPSGQLREPLGSVARADAIVLPETATDHAILRGKIVWRMKREIAVVDPPKAPIVFCGIARPEQFFAQVRATGILPSAEIAFPDHHFYRLRDIDRLLTACAKLSAGGFLATEKDVVNLGPLQSALAPLASAVLNVVLDNPAYIVDTILAGIGV